MKWKKILTSISCLAGASSIGLYTINKLIFLSANKEPSIYSKDGHFYNWKFGKIFYTTSGSGTPVLLIHDLTVCSSSYEWNKIIDKLSETNTVYTIDLLGCGQSDKPNLTYTNFLYVQLVTDFIKNVIKVQADIIASGISSSIVLGACHNDSSFINNIVLINPPDMNFLLNIPGKKEKIVSTILNLPLIGTFLYNVLHTKHYIENLFYSDYFYSQTASNKNIIQTYYKTAHCEHASAKHLYASLSGNYLTANIPYYLKNLENSIFIISGSNVLNNNDIVQAYKSQLPSIEVIKMKNAKQLLHLEYPTEFLEQISIFFESVC